MQRKHKPSVLAFSLALLLVGLTQRVRPLIAQLASVPRQELQTATSWTTEKWSGDDKPYTAARRNVDEAFSDGSITVSYLNGLEAASEKDEHDPLKLYRWSYARYKAQSLHPAIHFTTMPDYGAFDEVPSPHAYEYARVRFLIQTRFGDHPELMGVGKRLLAHEPNDFDVEYALASCFSQYMKATEKEAALEYSSHLIDKYPNKPSVYTVKAGVYFSYWIDHRNKQDARDAIRWYQQYLQRAPASDEWRAHAQKIIVLLQSRL